ncbi:DUF3551 domain-containing protein [Bradyrhizobium sp. 83012]|uniref:DUF3551 domain-containing protein n=1 Tax=Bradyrhizobium aeschynomenes TaxID=2734909 RepID=A0ABX2CB65_9BRAD|nr:DUF3551 domain-containing protein [Bradyrhizobium aeschynomenes]NPU11933.1 DUF3551 domain-containing protein [Bradyrhizobium aeschynomenes]NPU65481.1 DUF3551 domain-containing protein [Bradyrhizobium aeschynomenes]
MRKVMMMATGIVGVAFVSGGDVTPAVAGGYDYPWCVQGRGVGYPGDCSYQTFEQCRASASGRNAGCGINPRVAFNSDRRGPSVYVDMPPPRRVHRYNPY